MLIYDQRLKRWRDEKGRFVSNWRGVNYLKKTRTIHFISKNGKLYRNHEIADRMRVSIYEKQIETTFQKYTRTTVKTDSLDLTSYFTYVGGGLEITSKIARVLISSLIHVYEQRKTKNIRAYLYGEVDVLITKTKSKYNKKTKKMEREIEQFEDVIHFSTFQIHTSQRDVIDSMLDNFAEVSYNSIQSTPASDVMVLGYKVELVVKSW